MQTITNTSLDTALEIGELCVGADHACCHGDLATLASIALQLAAYTPEPVHCELALLVDLCRSRQSAHAIVTWFSIKDHVYRSAS